ncbi:hypothetical protein AB1Y20_021368 [Prymnesium parvum]|uniref:Uncharacterized protein n=1 Tax=Prymnesium parvum TaxID=97485 RepID=A0AB34JL22_PRYPA
MAAAAGVGVTAAPPLGTAAPPAVPPARLGVGPTATTVTRLVGAVAATDPDEFSLPADSPVVSAFPFLQWSRPTANGPVRIAKSELQGMCITACNFDLSDRAVASAVRIANLIEHGLSARACSGVLHELHDASCMPVAERLPD